MFGFGKKKDVFDQIFGDGAAQARVEFAPEPVASHESHVVADVPRFEYSALASYRHAWDDGEKFPGGFGTTLTLIPDYWTLRARSAQLFETNIYGRGVIRRLLTNELNTGLHLEAAPEESVLGKPEDSLADWSEDVETRFALWAKDPYLCDHYERSTFGELQVQARRESLIDGDVLVVMRQDKRTRLPRIQLIRGSSVSTPPLRDRNGGNKICHGVEIDAQGRHAAFWVAQDDGTHKRLPAYGEKSGRRLAWLIYGTDKRLDDVRGKPLLALVLQSLREVDRYRDSTQRKASILAMLAMFLEKTEDKQGSRAFTAGAVRKSVETVLDNEGHERSFKSQQHHPGMVIEELQHGEKPQAFQVNGTTETYGTFEEAIIQAVAWTLEIPPEILTLSFSSNYSASQAAVNEFKQYLNKVRMAFGEGFCEPIYQEWLISEVLNQRIVADGLLDAWRDYFNKHYVVGAWLASDWTGNVKPAVDLSKLVEAYKVLVEENFISRDQAARELTGTKLSKNQRKNRRDNLVQGEVNKPLAELEALTRPKPLPPGGAGGPPDDKTPAKPAKPAKSAEQQESNVAS